MTTDALAGWLENRGQPVSPPLTARRVGAGQSNLTFLLRDEVGREWVLRRPPSGSSAHDVGREARILSALADTPVPVPSVVGAGSDAAGIDGPFFVMHRSPGAPLEAEDDVAALSAQDRRDLAAEVVSVLAALHSVRPAEVGLDDLGPHEGYLDRQIRRTVRNWAAWGEDSPADPAWRACLRSLEVGMPRTQRTVIVHGDYRLSNLLIERGHVTAVLDWELCTLGDPLADLAWLIDDWRSPDDPAITMPSPTRAGGFPDRDTVVGDYGRRSGMDVSELDRYRAFTHWKAATLLQGVLIRRRGGGLGDHGALDLADLEHSISYLLNHALTLT